MSYFEGFDSIKAEIKETIEKEVEQEKEQEQKTGKKRRSTTEIIMDILDRKVFPRIEEAERKAVRIDSFNPKELAAQIKQELQKELPRTPEDIRYEFGKDPELKKKYKELWRRCLKDRQAGQKARDWYLLAQFLTYILEWKLL